MLPKSCRILAVKTFGRGHVTIALTRIKERYTKNIPSPEEFISKIRTKYNNDSQNVQPRSTSEMELMKDWLQEHRQKVELEAEPDIEIEINYDPREQYVEANPDFTKYFYLGISSYESGNFKESVNFFGKALRINPKHKEALRYLLKAFYYVKQNS
jgi:tetratricopeptide (TPR) repeat protein